MIYIPYTTMEKEFDPATVIAITEDEGNSISFSESDLIKYDETGQKTEDMLKYDRVILFRIMLEEE
jgi:hypothetical protein